jgi:hypothetical protein
VAGVRAAAVLVRIRQVRPEFWQDEIMAALPDPARLFYVGLWNVADDAGWMDWSPAKIGALLYPFRGRPTRERQITAWSDVLVGADRLVLYDCGCGHIPTLPRHQRISGIQSFAVKDRHEQDHGAAKRIARTATRSSLSHSPVRVGNVRVGEGRLEKTPPSPPRPDVIALESFGYKVTTKRLAVLDEVASHHDITGYEWAAAIIRANPTDAVGAVMAADQEWKAGRRREADDADAAWAAVKAADKRPRVVA